MEESVGERECGSGRAWERVCGRERGRECWRERVVERVCGRMRSLESVGEHGGESLWETVGERVW